MFTQGRSRLQAVSLEWGVQKRRTVSSALPRSRHESGKKQFSRPFSPRWTPKLLGANQKSAESGKREWGIPALLEERMEKQWDTQVKKGLPSPLGPSPQGNGVNFALYSRHASLVELVLYDDSGNFMEEIYLDPDVHRTDDVWHVFVDGLPKSGVCYGFKVHGAGGWETGNRWDPTAVLLDPYAPHAWGRKRFGVRDEFENFKPKFGSRFLGTYDFESEQYDWGANYKRPNIPFKDLVIYELPVRTFTADVSSEVPEGERGTFKGLMRKIPHLVELGVNCVELLPVFEYDELEFQRQKNSREHMVNIWGYSHISFMSPMGRFGSNGGGPIQAAKEFKDMVGALHAAGIEVILDVVYNHTAESDDKDPYLVSFRGIDNRVYYMVDTTKYVQLINYSGCGNTVNSNHPVVAQLIVDSLKHWVEEYHVDGFRFDLASCLCRDGSGKPIPAPPLIRQISKDPVLKNVKLIAEPWDLGMYQVGSFPNWDIWAEWNGKYRDDVRKFVIGEPGMKNDLATRIAGSADLYQTNARKPYHSINFVVAHDGFTLSDLVSYNSKHNEPNGERNQDGTNDNFSWNCGEEGETSDEGVFWLRQKQMRNMMVILMMSQGTPMILAGDEFGQSRYGNNNWYGHDSVMTHVLWPEPNENIRQNLFRFFAGLIDFRKNHPLLGRGEFLNPGDVSWHESNWEDDESRFLAFSLHDRGVGGGDIYCAMNAHGFSINCPLPPPPRGHKWCRVIDTNLASPKDYTPGGNNGVDSVYDIQSHSCIVLLAKPV
ncbi:hypothetical protein BSKO_11645 [Bryopsis sp. KO-2023]|nr:hypothetical protein BSKO_11645 [Bryopsis sp. KO-2023]